MRTTVSFVVKEKNMKAKYIFILFAGIALLTACKKDSIEKPTNDKIKITEAVSENGIKVTLWADREQLIVGYNPVYFTITNGDAELKDKTITLHPEMDMMSMKHSSPVEQPVYQESQGLYAGAVVFSMPSGEMGTWKLTVTVDGQSTDLNVTIASSPTNTKYTGTFKGTDDISYTISLVNPSTPKTGLNDLEILINKRESMDSFPPVDDFEIEFNPQMESMNHGSPNNVNPVSTGNGRYKGKANFTMTGDWRLFFTLKRGGEIIVENAYLDILF